MFRPNLRSNPIFRSLLTPSTRLSSSSSTTNSPSTSSSSPSKQQELNTQSTQPSSSAQELSASSNQSPSQEPKKKKTIAEQDAELQQKMSGLAGDGGEAGVELEDGQPVSMKRSVRNNMFRYI